MTLQITTRRVDDERPLAHLLPDRHGILFLRRGEGFAAWGTAASIDPGVGPGRGTRVASRLAHVASTTVGGDPHDLVAFASLTFDRRRVGSRVVVPRRILRRRDGVTRLVSIDPLDDASGATGGSAPAGPGSAGAPEAHHDRLRYAGSSLPDLRWLEAVATSIARIEDGELDKVVLARDHALWCADTFDARHLAERLSRRFPDCWTFLQDGLLGATPELLARREGSDVTSIVLAGTTGRDPDPAVDARLGQALLDSDKDQREHAHAARSVRDGLADLGRVCAPDTPSLVGLQNVQHLATRLTAVLDPSATDPARRPSVIEVADHLHPTAAICGTPSDLAMAAIDELEGMDRGRYGGPVGWMDGNGDGEMALALRCALLSGARARLFAGVGLVAGSLPESELEETRLKLLAMQGALAPT